MMRPMQSRREICLGLAALCAVTGTGLRAEDVVKLGWKDLLPKDDASLPQALEGLVQHDAVPSRSDQPVSSGVRTEWTGRTVSLSGFLVPLDYEGTAVTAFMLVPYVGACIHVPPPPANQLVLVTTEEPYNAKGMFEAVTVTGMFGTASVSTQLADVGYALSADQVVPYRG